MTEFVPFAEIGVLGFALIASVVSVRASWLASGYAKKVHSTASLHAELLEIRDYMSKIDAWAKRINAREVMQERRDSTSSTSTSGKRNSAEPSDPAQLKAYLRRKAGLIAGVPAKHDG